MADTRKAFDTLAAGELPSWWPELVANGLHAVHVPARYGGQGGGLLGAACVLGAAREVSLPGPLLTAAAAGAVALLAAETPAREGLLVGLGAGARATVVLAQHAGFAARPVADGGWVTGVSEVVSGACSAQLALVCAGRADGAAIWLAVDLARPQVAVRPASGTDVLTDLGTISLTHYPAAPAAALAGTDSGRAECLPVGLAAAVSGGIAAWCVEAATEHLRTREQFGKPIGTFQALQHRAAMLLVNTELARAAAIGRAS